MYEEFLKKYGLKFEDLNSIEREYLIKWAESVQQSTITIEKVREYIEAMRDSVSQELENEPEFIQFLIFKYENRKQILLKARLRNYRLLIALLSSPEKARKTIDEALSKIKKA